MKCCWFTCVALLLLLAATTNAANKTWDGEGADSLWTSGTNWNADTAPNGTNDAAFFDGIVRLTNTNDFTPNSIFNGVTFNTTAGAFVLNGNSILLNGNVTDSSLATQTINLDMEVGVTRSFTVFNGGNLVVNGTISGLGGLTKQRQGTLTLNGSNSYLGTTTISGGILALGTTGFIPGASPLTLGNGQLTFAGGAAAARTVNTGVLTLNLGRNVISITANGAQPARLIADSLGNRAIGSTQLFRGSALGTGTGAAGVASILFTNAPTPSVTFGAFANLSGASTPGNTDVAVIRGALVSSSAGGLGTTFATYDPATGIRALNSSTEQVTTYPVTIPNFDNVRLNLASGTTAITGVTTNTLQLVNDSGGLATVANSGNLLNPSNGLLFTGSSAITLTGGSITFDQSLAVTPADLIILSANTAGVTIGSTVTAANGPNGRSITFGGSGNITLIGTLSLGGGGGFYYGGVGTLTLAGVYAPSSAGLIITSGTVKLATGFVPNNQVSNIRPITPWLGTTFDMNGVSAPFEYLANDPNGFSGTITNTSVTPSTLTLTLVNSGSTGIGNTTFGGTITGNMGLAITSGTTVTASTHLLTGSNTYTGATTINSGNLRIGANNALPVTTNLTVGGQTTGFPASVLELNGFNQTVASLSGVVASGTATIQSTLSGTSTLTVNGTGSTTYAGSLLEGGTTGAALALVKAGTGSLTLSGSGNYSAGTTVNGGTLKVNSLLSGTGVFTVNSGGVLGGTGTIASIVTVNANGRVAPGNSVGTLTLRGLTLSGSILDYELGGTSDRIVLTGTDSLSITGSNSLFLYQPDSTIAFSTPGIYNLVQYIGNILGSGSLTVANPQSFRSYSTGTSGGFLTLTIASTSTSGTWSGTAGDSNYGTPSNWVGGVIPTFAGDAATFPTVANTSVNLQGNRALGDILFNSSNSYLISSGTGGTLNLDNGSNVATISNTLGTHTISAPIIFSSSNTAISVTGAANSVTLSGPVSGASALLKTGSGLLALTGSNSYVGGTTLNGGVTQINSATSLGAAASGVTINSATLQALNDITTTRAITLGAANSTIQVDGTSTYQTTGNTTSAGGNLIKTGPGTLILAGVTNSTGTASIQSGALQVGNGGASTTTVTGLTGTGNFTQNGGTVNLFGSNTTYGGLLTVNNGNLVLSSSSATITGTSGTVLNSSTVTALTNTTIGNGAPVAGPFSKLTVSGTIALDPGANTLVLGSELTGTAAIIRTSGTGTVTIGPPVGGTVFNNAGFFGSFTSTIGNVNFIARQAGSQNAAWTFTGGGSVNTGNPGGTISFGALAGSNNIGANNSSTRMNVGALGLSTTYSGIIGITFGNQIGIAKTGTGSLTLSAQNLHGGTAATNITGVPTQIQGGTIIAAASSTGTTSGPLGPTNGLAPVVDTNTGTTGLVLIGANGTLSDSSLLLSGSVTIGNGIVVGAGSGATTPGTYTLSIGGATDNSSSFTGAILLENNLTVTQVATSAGRSLTIASDIKGTQALVGPSNVSAALGGAAISGTTAVNNTGIQTITFAGPGRINVTGTIGNGGATAVNLANTGGITTLSGSMIYTGTTTVTGGQLIVAASISGTGNSAASVSLSGSGTLGGGGSINLAAGNQVLSGSGATISPGNVDNNGVSQAGRLTITDAGTPNGGGTLSLATGSRLFLQLSGSTAGVTYDQVSVFGTINLSGASLEGSLINGFLPQIGDKFFIMLNDGSDAVSGMFAQGTSVVFDSGLGSRTFSINYADNGDGGGVANDISITVTAIPEPGTWGLVATGFAFLTWARGKRRKESPVSR